MSCVGISYVEVVNYASTQKHHYSTSAKSILGYRIQILKESDGYAYWWIDCFYYITINLPKSSGGYR